MRSSAPALAFCALLLASVAAQASDTYCASDKPVLDAGGLCYTPCNPGYKGVGPVCYRTHRSSDCDPGTEKDGALCYPTCKAGYKGVGPVCWQSCPGSDYHDDGAYCRKPGEYGRGAGYPWKGGDKAFSLTGAKQRCEKSNSQGCEKSGAIYYPKCKDGYEASGCCLCKFKSCPSGMKDIGVSCQKDSYGRTAGRDSNSYARGAGVVPKSCSSSDIAKSCDSTTTTTPFTMLFASDVQTTWYSTAGCATACVLPYGDCANDECKDKNANKTNENQFGGLNSVDQLSWPPQAGRAHPSPSGLIVNGDLTSYYHPEEEEWMEHYLRSSRWNVFPGLGNHDYENNWNDCKGLTTDGQHCLNRALVFMRSSISCGHLSKFPASKIHNYDRNSMAYSWDQGSYHFVQLHNRPNYPTSAVKSDAKIVGTNLFGQSLTWLKNDLAAATKAGKNIVLNMHNFEDAKGDSDFIAAVANTNVRAIFVGHLHDLYGKNGSAYSNNSGDFIAGGKTIPYFYSGSSLFMTFLLAEFGPHSIKVAVVDSSSGKAQYKKGTDGAPIVSDVTF